MPKQNKKKLYYGIGKVPKGSRRATISQSIRKGQIRHWGVKRIPKKYILQYQLPIKRRLTEYDKFIKYQIPFLERQFPGLLPRDYMKMAAKVWRASNPVLRVKDPSSDFLTREIDIPDIFDEFPDLDIDYENLYDDDLNEYVNNIDNRVNLDIVSRSRYEDDDELSEIEDVFEDYVDGEELSELDFEEDYGNETFDEIEMVDRDIDYVVDRNLSRFPELMNDIGEIKYGVKNYLKDNVNELVAQRYPIIYDEDLNTPIIEEEEVVNEVNRANKTHTLKYTPAKVINNARILSRRYARELHKWYNDKILSNPKKVRLSEDFFKSLSEGLVFDILKNFKLYPRSQ